MEKRFNLNKKGQGLIEFMIISFLMAMIIHATFNVYQKSYEVMEEKQWNN